MATTCDVFKVRMTTSHGLVTLSVAKGTIYDGICHAGLTTLSLEHS